MTRADLPLVTFRDAAAFETWLETQPGDAAGAWLCFAKQGSSGATVTKSDAIDCALTYGWIDGQLGRVDATAFKTLFTPRRPRSAWSQINCERVERLIAAGRMAPRGLAQVELAKSDGRWARAYASAATASPDAELQTALDAAPSARAFFELLDSANRYAVLYRVQQAKTPEKRAAKIARLVAMLARGEAIHPRRQRR
jgi:uncharacterized protein YdeI (YjbR/CyaY-like superfamily)